MIALQFKKIAGFVFLITLISSCGAGYHAFKGNEKTARETKYENFYKTMDGKIVQAGSLAKYQYFTPFGGDYIVVDGRKVSKFDIKAFQNKSGYYANVADQWVDKKHPDAKA